MTFLALLLLAATSFAADTYHYVYDGKVRHMPVVEVEGVRVNDICAKDLKKCAALKTYRGPSKIKGFSGAKEGQIAGAYCERVGGALLWAHQDKSPEVLFCLFEDLSVVDAEALYAHHFGGKK